MLTAQMLTAREAKSEARVSLSLIYLWAHEGRFVVSRAGGRGKRGKVLIDAVSFRAFLESLKVRPAEPLVHIRPR
jgi:hypothetical protein